MKKYKRKPIEVEAIQLKDTDESIIAAIEWVDKIDTSTSAIGIQAMISKVRKDKGLIIERIDNKMLASFGDFIIKDVSGSFHPCKPDIFQKTYDQIGERSYKKKEIVIEAVKWTGKNRQEVEEFCKPNDYLFLKDGVLKINTLEGIETVNKTDYIIKGIKGEIYPCKSFVFESIYRSRF